MQLESALGKDLTNASYEANVVLIDRSTVGLQLVIPGPRLSSGSFVDTSTSSNSVRNGKAQREANTTQTSILTLTWIRFQGSGNDSLILDRIHRARGIHNSSIWLEQFHGTLKDPKLKAAT